MVEIYGGGNHARELGQGSLGARGTARRNENHEALPPPPPPPYTVETFFA